MELLNFFKNCFVSVFSGVFIFWFLAILIIFACFLFVCKLLCRRG